MASIPPLLHVSTLRILTLLSVSDVLTASVQLLVQRAHRKRERTGIHPANH